jgi:HAMP domain-containing protein
MLKRVRHNSATPRRFKGRLGRRMAIILLPFMLIPVLLMGAAAYFRARDILKQQANAQMTSAVQAQIQVLDEWVATREQTLQLNAQSASFLELARELLFPTGTSEDREEIKEGIRAELENLQTGERQTLFSEILVVRATDRIILVSTQHEWEDVLLPSMVEGSIDVGTLSTTPLFDDPLFAPGNLAFVTNVPLHLTPRSEGPDVLVIGINVKLRLGALMNQMQVFWETRGEYRIMRGDTYILLAPDVIVSLGRYATEPEATAGQTHPVFGAAQVESSGTVEFTNLEEEPVLVSYEWLPEWDLGVIIERPQVDIFAEINSLAPFTVALILVAAILTVLVVAFTTSRILRPLGTLTNFAERISRGEWQHRVPEDRDDELGALAAAFNRMADDLSDMYKSLEDRVEERTRQIRTASEVARAVISTPSLEDLLPRAVRFIRDQFGYYHVSIFMLDDEGKFAELRESTGETGDAQKARGHRLEVGSKTIIGWVIDNNQSRAVSDVSEDTDEYRSEFLPETRSEVAVPLQVGGRVLGALDVQSRDSQTFNIQDVEILQTLADQLSAAIQNARLAQTSVVAAERARVLSDVTSEMSRLMEVDEVLETAARALHKSLGQPDVVVKLHVLEERELQELG